VSNCHLVCSDVIVTEVRELLSGELGAVVSDDSIGDPKAGDNALDKAYHFFGANFGHGPCRGPIPQVPRAAVYGPTTVDMTWFPPAANGWGTLYPVLDMPPPRSWLKVRDH
jgi:hypothetical protein